MMMSPQVQQASPMAMQVPVQMMPQGQPRGAQVPAMMQPMMQPMMPQPMVQPMMQQPMTAMQPLPSAPGLTPFNFGTKHRDIEPMLLLDTTGSMNYAVSERDRTPKREVVREAIGTLVARLGAVDSQAAHEEGGGGLRTVTFAGGHGHDLDDLNSHNLSSKWGHIHWGGSTQLMPGWKKLKKAYNEEFGDLPADKKPILLALIITDGEAEDIDEFGQVLAHADNDCYAVVCVVGSGDDHNAAMASFETVARANLHIKVFSMDSTSDPALIAGSLLTMIQN